MQQNVIRRDQVEFSSLSMLDEMGKVFTWRGQVYRAVKAEALPLVEKLFASGLVKRLEERGLIPESRLTDHTLEGYARVISHETAPVVTYPHEWSFEMLRRAALLVLEVNRIAMEHGYQTKDCHPYNVIFFGDRPKFVDIGSLGAVDPGFAQHLYVYYEFCKCYLFPLRVWAAGDAFTARRYLQRWKLMTPPEAYIAYRLGGDKGPARRAIRKAWMLAHKAQAIPHFLAADNGSKRPEKHKRIARVIAGLGFPLRPSRLSTLRREVERLRPAGNASIWGDYHGRFYGAGEKPVLSERFLKIVDIVGKLGVRSVTDIGGNQGLLSETIAVLPGVNRVICMDADDIAIDAGYRRSGAVEELAAKLTYAVVNPFYPEANWLEPPPPARLKSELAMALAITHHLVLDQGYTLDYVLSTVESYATRYVIVEFMPLGLYSSATDSGPPVPAWYTQDWFVAEFERHFRLVDVIPAETNRVIIVGALVAK